MRTNTLFIALSTTLLILVGACNTTTKEETVAKTEPGINLTHMDTTISPREDFYKFANGGWLRNNTIPDDESSWGGFMVLVDSTRNDVLDIMARTQKSGEYAPNSDQGKALAVFQSAMDTATRNTRGVAPLKPLLEAIDGISSILDMQTVYATTQGVEVPFMGIYVFADLNNSSVNTAYLGSGILGLPEREYYLDQDEKSKEQRKKYVDHITQMLQFIDFPADEAKKAADRILEMETQLAEPRLDKVANRDVRNYNNPRAIGDLEKMVPAIDWEKLLNDLGGKKNADSIIVWHLEHTKALQDFLTKTPLEDIKLLTKWTTLNRNASFLSTEIEQVNWDFYAKELNGQKAMKPLDQRALEEVTDGLGEAIGQIYVKEKFPPEAKAKAEKMIANVITAFKSRINQLEWMGDSTKIKAIEKLDKMTIKIGYPDEWEDYSGVKVTQENGYFENVMSMNQWARDKSMSKIGEPVDKGEWVMPPQMVNAYFHPLHNEIVFPAAILQPPFYNYTADEAVNYGGIGAVIGHEISHAFDDSGARFDSDGNASNWWTDKDLSNFEQRTGKLAEQYSKIAVLDSVFINGKFTLGENIGDLGGVLGAYDGLQLFFKTNGKPQNIDGFTPEQRFFISYATGWRALTREDALRTQVKIDPHSPDEVRGYQPLKNVDAFYDAFGIQEGDGMYLSPEERVYIW